MSTARDSLVLLQSRRLDDAALIGTLTLFGLAASLRDGAPGWWDDAAVIHHERRDGTGDPDRARLVGRP